MAGSRGLPGTPLASKSSERQKKTGLPPGERRAPSSPLRCPSIQLSKSPAKRRKPLREPHSLSFAWHSLPFAKRGGAFAAHSLPFVVHSLAFAACHRQGMRREGSLQPHSPFIACREGHSSRHSPHEAPLEGEGMPRPQVSAPCT